MSDESTVGTHNTTRQLAIGTEVAFLMAIGHLTFSSIHFVKTLFEKLNSYDIVNVSVQIVEAHGLGKYLPHVEKHK